MARASRRSGSQPKAMRILWVKVGGLWPLTAGGRLRSFHILSELSQWHRVVVLTTHGRGDDPQGLAAALPHCERVVSVPHVASKQGSARFAATLLRSWLSPFPVDFWRWRVPALADLVTRTIEGGGVDLCVADFLASTPNVSFPGPVPTVLFAHNVEHIIWKRLSRVDRPIWERVVLGLEWRKVCWWEARVSMQTQLTLAVSEVDRTLLGTLAPGARVRAIPTGVDPMYFAPNGKSEAPAKLVFTGSMDWYPNEDAIIHFSDAILPTIRREIPEATLTVVGRNPTARLRGAAAAARIRVTGTVDDVRPYVSEAAVYVVPLRIGGGTRLKIFEALAMGKAVVSTRVGAEGLPLEPGVHFLRADEPADFARAVISLLRDPGRRKALATAGRRLIEERFSWSQVAREFEAHCVEVVPAMARRQDVWEGSARPCA
jgi:glycosyltransferase involved in cell wall biosynthesis